MSRDLRQRCVELASARSRWDEPPLTQPFTTCFLQPSRTTMRIIFSICCITLIAFTGVARAQDKAPKPLKALLITGGCCHDYAKQKDLLKAGIEARAHVVVDQIHTADTTTKARFAIYEKANWAQGYDVIIHDEC